jgi:hypothetical protein
MFNFTVPLSLKRPVSAFIMIFAVKPSFVVADPGERLRATAPRSSLPAGTGACAAPAGHSLALRAAGPH